MSYLQAAFDQIVKGARTPEVWYVSLVECSQRYGGPEEGGWWTTDTDVVAFHEFPTRSLAEAARARVYELAQELEREARTEHGRQCLREMEWLGERGLDADYLPEPDGPTEYKVVVADHIPASHRGPTHYE